LSTGVPDIWSETSEQQIRVGLGLIRTEEQGKHDVQLITFQLNFESQSVTCQYRHRNLRESFRTLQRLEPPEKFSEPPKSVYWQRTVLLIQLSTEHWSIKQSWLKIARTGEKECYRSSEVQWNFESRSAYSGLQGSEPPRIFSEPPSLCQPYCILTFDSTFN
jgi:hypothetical protein